MISLCIISNSIFLVLLVRMTPDFVCHMDRRRTQSQNNNSGTHVTANDQPRRDVVAQGRWPKPETA